MRMNDLPSSVFHPPTSASPAESGTHLLQSQAWGELKSRFGWSAQRVQASGVAAQILFRRLPLGFTLAYIPNRPIIHSTNNEQATRLFTVIHSEDKERRAILLKVEPDIWRMDCPSDLPEPATNFLTGPGFIPGDAIQPRTSLVIDLRSDED